MQGIRPPNYPPSPAQTTNLPRFLVLSMFNALAETVNGLYKAELTHRQGPWKSFEAVEYATLEWVDWFNNRRLLEPIGNIPPAEAEQRYHDAVNAQTLAA